MQPMSILASTQSTGFNYSYCSMPLIYTGAKDNFFVVLSAVSSDFN